MKTETSRDFNDEADLKIIQIGKDKMKIQYKSKFAIIEPNRYDINSLMMLIDLKKINRIEEEFQNTPDGLCRIDFIKLLKTELLNASNDPFNELNLIYGLYKLFGEIDLSGDGIMQWSEFTQFMIDRVEGEDDSSDPNDTKGIKEKEMIKYKRYKISAKIKDYNIHKKGIISAIYYTKIDKLFLCEYDSKIVKIYNPRNGKCELNFDIELYFQQKMLEAKKNKGGITKKKKFTIEVIKSLTFSVLHLCINPMNILALCLSSNKICFFVFNSELKGNCLYELQTTALQKRVWFLSEHNIWLSSGRKHDNDKYYYLYELDIEFEKIGNKIECNYNEGHWYRSTFIDHPNGYKDEILDVIEITRPMLIMTACMDGKIRLVSLLDKEFLAVWSHHEGGVRTLDYNPLIDTNGLIISTGFEYYINLYSTDLSIYDAFKGKLEGHYAPVVSCRFLAKSYMCASVDEDCLVKIWDAKLRQCLQSIASDKKNLIINQLLYMSKYNKFIIYGNKMIFYDAKYQDSEIAKQTEEQVEINYPFQCEFNKYYMRFYIATMKDLRIYSSENGNLIYVFKKFMDQERFDIDTKIRCFSFDYRHRLIYIGFSNGTVQQFNSGNGSLIKPINEYEIEKDGISSIKTHHTQDVTSMFLFSNHPESPEPNFILATTGLDSLVNMYNVKDPEESMKLRCVKGSHKVDEKINEILCMDFSKRYNLYATGSIDGLVVIWDFEFTKMEDLCFIQSYHPGNYNAILLKFLDPYPVLAVAYSDGPLFLWGVKPNTQYKGQCFFRTKNLFKKENSFIPIPISSIEFLHYYSEEDLPQKEKYAKEYLTHLPNEMIIDDDLQNNPQYYINKNEKDYLIIGDEKGWLKFIDLRPIFLKFNICIMDELEIQSSFNILKKEEVHAESSLIFLLQKRKSFLNEFTSLYPNLIPYEKSIHLDSVIHLSLIEEPFSFISVSKDQRIKIWNLQIEVIGEIYTGISSPNPPISDWKFCIDLEKLKRKEIIELLEILKEVDSDSTYFLSMVQEKEFLNKNDNINKTEEDEFLIKANNPFKKKRFQKIINKDKDKERHRKHEEENRLNESYEGKYIQKIKKKIETMFCDSGPDIGINEMSRHVIDNIAANKDVSDLFGPPQEVANKVIPKKLPKLSSSMSVKLLREDADERQGLFSEKFIKKGEDNVKDRLILPLINHEFKSNPNVKFRRGETEKILMFNYYQNSYQQCCKLERSGQSVSVLRANHHLMWNFVKNYNKLLFSQKEKKTTQEANAK